LWFFVPHPKRNAAPQLDATAVAEYAEAESRYAETRLELQAALDARIKSGDLQLDSVTQESLSMVGDAIKQLRDALKVDPGNQHLRQLLLATYDREISLLRRITTLPGREPSR